MVEEQTVNEIHGHVKAIIMIVSGCTLAVAFGQHKSNVMDLDKIFSLYSTTRFRWYAICVAFTAAIMFACICQIERKNSLYDDKTSTFVCLH